MLSRGRIPSLAAALLLAAAGLVAVSAGPAAADSTGSCSVDALGLSTCSADGSSPGGSGDGGTASGGICMDASASVVFDGQTYPCGSSDAPGQWWYVGGGCYSARAPESVWPPDGDPRWGGHTMADNGFIVYRDCNDGTAPSIGGSYLTWERCIGNCVDFSPTDVMARMNMQAPALVMQPPAGKTGFVHQNVWVWTGTDMADHTVTENSGANVIVATRKLTGIDWYWEYDPGKATQTNVTHTSGWPLACRPWRSSDGGNPAPAGCGYAYDQQGKVVNGAVQPYTIHIVAHWTFTYSYNGGPEKTLTVPDPHYDTTITIKENQAANG